MKRKRGKTTWSSFWKEHPKLRKFSVWFVAPVLIFSFIFFLVQPHYIGNFSNGFYLDAGDGFQNVWNIWWVEESIVDRNSQPYFTDAVSYPHGTTLVPQTMNIFNGLMAIPLMNVFGFSLVEAVNFAVVFSFVMAGVTMFWFIQKLYGKYWVSIVAGALYTFSSYHFAHGLGHLQLVSMEWIPLFLLAFWTMLEKLRYRDAFFASGALFLVLLCDYYYLMWCVFLGAMWVLWKLYKKELKLKKHTLKVLGLFGGLCLVLIGPLMYKLWSLSRGDKLLGSHNAEMFSLDPLTVFIPGGSWYWSSLTSWHWKNLPYAAEVSVYFGIGLLILVAISLLAWKKLKPPSWMAFWWIVLCVFGILAMGPHPTSFGRTINSIPLPYAALVHIMPSLKISGMPVRWILISLIAAIVIGSFVLTKININRRSGIILASIFVFVSFVDLYPFRLPLTLAKQYDFAYVNFLKTQSKGGVIDDAAPSATIQLYNQTDHEFPMAFGYTTRMTRDVDEKNFHIFAALAQKRYHELCQNYKIRYVTLPPSRPLDTQVYPIIYQDKEAIIYDMKNSPNC